MTENVLTLLGLGITGAALAAILWSVLRPSARLWPPIRYTALTPVLVWVPTFTLFGAIIALGVLGWGTLDLPHWLRFGLGVPMIVFGNLVVWSAVAKFGLPKTGGATGGLQTDGLYHYSRNPQYLADIGIILGWIVLTAAPLAAVVGTATIVVLLAAPFCEEPWLRSQYGDAFDAYAARVRRFI